MSEANQTPDDQIIAFTFTRGGKVYHAWKASEETLARLNLPRNGECRCGTADFCDNFTHRWVRCFHVGGDRCELYETSALCP
jgi:hypothetical protein